MYPHVSIHMLSSHICLVVFTTLLHFAMVKQLVNFTQNASEIGCTLKNMSVNKKKRRETSSFKVPFQLVTFHISTRFTTSFLA